MLLINDTMEGRGKVFVRSLLNLCVCECVIVCQRPHSCALDPVKCAFVSLKCVFVTFLCVFVSA